MSDTHYSDPDYASASEVAEIESLMAGPLRLRDLLDAPSNARQDAALALVLLGAAVFAAFAGSLVSVVAFTLASIIFVDRVDCWLRADRECLGCRYQTQRFAHRQHRSWLKLTYGGQVAVMLVLVLVGTLSWDLSVGAFATWLVEVLPAPAVAFAAGFGELLLAMFGAPAEILVTGTARSFESLVGALGPFALPVVLLAALVPLWLITEYVTEAPDVRPPPTVGLPELHWDEDTKEQIADDEDGEDDAEVDDAD